MKRECKCRCDGCVIIAFILAIIGLALLVLSFSSSPAVHAFLAFEIFYLGTLTFPILGIVFSVCGLKCKCKPRWLAVVALIISLITLIGFIVSWTRLLEILRVLCPVSR